MRHGEKDRERGMHVGGGTRGILYRGGGVCEYENDEKSGGSEASLERFIDRCVSERSCGDSGRTT